MASNLAAIKHVSDTALLVAGLRAVEAAREDKLVHDPFIARLAGERGLAMFQSLPHPEIMCFGIAIRTRFIDELVLEALASGKIETVLVLGAGLDTRPWRLDLPPKLRWIEVDLPPMLDYKEALLKDETTRCRRERLAADLNDPEQRARVYSAIGNAPALMLTEGLLMYLPASTVYAFAEEALQKTRIAHWILDVTTTAFSAAIRGGGNSAVRHVQAADHLTGEEILQSLSERGWRPTFLRSYIRDLAFASDRISKTMGAAESPPQPPPNFDINDPAGVHRFDRSSLSA